MRSLIKKLFFRPLIFLNLLWLLIKPIFFKLRRYLFTAKRRIGRSAVCLIFIMGGFALPSELFAAEKISDSKRLELLSLLAQDENAEVRKQAVKEAGEISYKPEAIQILFLLAQDENAEVRKQTAIAAGEIGYKPEAIQILSLLAQDENAEVRKQTAIAAGEIGYKPEAIQILSLLAQDESENVRLQVANTLWELRHWWHGNANQPESLRVLSRLAQDKNTEVRKLARFFIYLQSSKLTYVGITAFKILFINQEEMDKKINKFLNNTGFALPPELLEAEEISDSKRLELLSLLAQDENAEVRKQAVWAAIKIGYKPETIQILSLFAQDESENVRLQVAKAVEEIGYKPETIQILSLLAQDESENIRLRMAYAAGLIGYKPETIQILSLLAQDESKNVRLQVVQAVHQFKRVHSEQPDSLQILSRLALDEDTKVRNSAKATLYLRGKGGTMNSIIASAQLLLAPVMLNPKIIEPKIDLFLNKIGYNLPPELFEAEEISDPKRLELLSQLAQDENVEVRIQAVWAAAIKIGYKPETIQILSLFAQDESENVRLQVAKAVEEIGYKPETIQILSQLAQDESENVRLQVANTLWKLSHWWHGNAKQPESLRVLSGLAQDEDTRVRHFARNVLYHWGGKGALYNRIGTIVRRTYDDPKLREAEIAARDWFLKKRGFLETNKSKEKQ